MTQTFSCMVGSTDIVEHRRARPCSLYSESYYVAQSSWPSGWCIGLRSWLRGFDARLGHLYDACTSLPQKSQAAIKWLEIKKYVAQSDFFSFHMI